MMPPLIQRFGPNEFGRDLVVGDIHGHFTQLQVKLDAVGFDPSVDRLFSTGDLVDRGPESHLAVEWLRKPWFHAVCGNHDDFVCRYETVDTENWIKNGGSWFIFGLTNQEKVEVAAKFRELPIAIEVSTRDGLVGIVHADSPVKNWEEFAFALDQVGQMTPKAIKTLVNTALWSRTRFDERNDDHVIGVRAVVVGHNRIERPLLLGNVHHIDTMGWLPERGGVFTLLDLATLDVISA